jgi:hypothetical protein
VAERSRRIAAYLRRLASVDAAIETAVEAAPLGGTTDRDCRPAFAMPLTAVPEQAAVLMGDESARASRVEPVLADWERLLARETPTEPEAEILEAIVLPILRPVYDIVEDSFVDPPPPWSHLGQH